MRSLYLVLTLTAMLAGPATLAAAGTEPCLAPDAPACTEDEDPCTVDHCVAGVCVHDPVPNRVVCDPVLDAYRRTLGLGTFVDGLQALVPEKGLPDSARFVVDGALAQIAADLHAASRALAGHDVPPPAGGETPAQIRARAAFDVVRVTLPRVRTLKRAFVSARPAVEREVAADLARRARFLYRSTKRLRRELRRLQRVSGVFAR